MKKLNRKSKRVLFDPDVIATAVSQAVEQDFREAQHVYCLNDSTVLYALNRQAGEILKKYCSPTQDVERLESETYAKFREVNEHMRVINESLASSLPDPLTRIQSSTPMSERIHLRAKALMNSVLGPFCLEEVYNQAKHSSGATVGVSYKDTSMEAKWVLPMTVTERAEEYIAEYLTWDHQLRDAVDKFNGERPLCGWYDVKNQSRATTVEKTTKKRRFISVEPTANMFLQQGLMRFLYGRMKLVGLDVETLPLTHKMLARESSISCRNATIDWSSASDCVSLELLRWLLPKEWFEIIWDLRCDFASIEGEDVALNMISTMGNAVTFPLETLVFWTYAHAVRLSTKPGNSLFPEWEDLSLCSVFGDDCIVPSEIAHEYIHALEGVGFIVNEEKTFVDQLQFRESCGGDYLAGYDVRPFFLKAPSSCSLSALEPWLYIIVNELLQKYISYFGSLAYVYDKHVFRYLFSLFERYKLKVKLVPPFYPPDAGITSSDVGRLKREYGFSCDRIDVGNHGTVVFRYLSFRYWEDRNIDDGLRYSDWLKNPVILDRVPFKKLPIRKRGGYVVAKGATGHWSVPQITCGPM